MSRIKLRLVGCERYNYKGELYLKGKVYNVGEVKATNMLRDEDAYGRPFFATYVKPVKSKAQRIAEAAAVAAAAAAEAEANEVIERPDGSEPDVADESVATEEVEVEEEEVEEEVDHDEDDLDLDTDDEENPEEVDEGEDEDRDDGSAVEV